MQQLKDLAPVLHRWNKKHSDDFEQQIDECRKKLVDYRRSFNLESSTKYVEEKTLLAAKNREQDTYWKQRSKGRWLQLEITIPAIFIT